MKPLDNSASSDNDTGRMRLWGMIKDIRFAMFTSRHANGHLHARPMTTQNSSVDEDASLWFFMSRRGEPVADLVLEPLVNVAYADPDANRYVSVSGTAEVVDDAGKKQQLWTKAAAAWFPGGSTDADLALVQVRIIHANYWHNDESKMMQLLHMASAVVSGKAATLGEKTRIDMG